MTPSRHLGVCSRMAPGASACLLTGVAAVADPPPMVFRAADGLEPGDAVLLYGSGLERADTVRVWRLPDDPSALEPTAIPPDAIETKAFQSSPQSRRAITLPHESRSP